jgi:hypothetical protein
MVRTNQLEKEVTEGASYLDCFRGTNRRRTEISMLAFGCQVTCGLYFATNSTYFFEIVRPHDPSPMSRKLTRDCRQVFRTVTPSRCPSGQSPLPVSSVKSILSPTAHHHSAHQFQLSEHSERGF